MAPSAHALLSPSSAERWMHCPASVALSVDAKDEETDYAREGTLFHAVCEEAVKAVKSGTGDVSARLADVRSAGFDADEAAEVSREWAAFADSLCVGTLMPEHPLSIGHLTGEEGAKGTADLAWFSPDGDLVRIADLKMGRNPVEVVRNRQLMTYAAALADECAVLFGHRPMAAVLTIFQPRIGGFSHWAVTDGDLQSWAAEVKAAAARAFDCIGREPSAEDFGPTEKGCRYCPARNSCRARASSAMRVAVENGAETELCVKDVGGVRLSLAEIAHALDAVPAVKAWCADIEKAGLEAAMEGRTPPGYVLGKGRAGVRKWEDEKTASVALRAMLGDGVFGEPTLLSPTQLEKKFKKALTTEQAEAISGLVTRGEAKSVLTKVKEDEAEAPKASARMSPADYPDESGCSNAHNR